MFQYKIIAGLGNPGVRYRDTRHNLGFLLLDALADRGCEPVFWKKKFDAFWTKTELADSEVMLIKPAAFMNLSGEPVKRFMDYFKVEASGLVVVHDDIDLPLGSVRIKKGGGDGGHKGIRSVSNVLTTGDYVRVRLGIGRPPEFDGREMEASAWVLGKIEPEEGREVERMIERGIQAVETLLAKGLEEAQRNFN